MNLALATGPLAQAIGWALVHLLWQGALVAALLAAALALLAGRSANLRYALSCAALLLIVVLGVATGVRSYAPADTNAATAGAGILAGSAAPVVLVATPSTSLDRLRDLGRAANDALPVLVTLWLLGVALFSVRLIVEWLRARRLVARSTTPAREPWQEVARRLRLALGVRRVVRLLESTAVVVPSVIGFVRPAILLPASALSGLTPAQLEMILAHEIAHIRRHDFLVNLLQSVVETLLFYHPAVWWISRRVRDERENCCDDLAVAVCGNPLQYARALTRLEELRADALPLAASANGGSLFERIRRISGGSTRDRGSAVRGPAALSAALCVLVALVTITLPAIGHWAPASKHLEASTPLSEPAPALPVAKRAVAAPARPALAPAVSAFAAPSDLAATTLDDGAESDDSAPSDDELEDAGEPAPDVAADPDGRPTLDELIALRAQNVTPETIRAVRALLPGTSLKDIASMSAVGATPDFVRAMRRAGLDVRTAQEAMGLAAVGVTVEFVRAMRSAGLAVESAQEAQGLAAVGVTSEFIRGLRAAGIAVESASQAQSLAAVGVTPDYVRRMRRAGVEIAGAEDAQSLQALGVTPQFVERLARAGYRDLTVEQLTRLGASGMTGDFVEEMSKYRSQ